MRCRLALCTTTIVAFVSLFLTITAQETQLELAKPIEREMTGGQSHAYQLSLAAEQYLHLIVEQRGIDVVVIVSAADGKKLAEVDSPNGIRGPEVVSVITAAAGTHRVEVRSLETKAAAGRYEIKLQTLRAATTQDKSRVEAERIFLEAAQLHSRGQREALLQAIEKYTAALPHWRAAQDINNEAETLLSIGRCHISLNEAPKAVSWVEQALALQRKAGDRKGEAEALHQLGRAYFFANNNPRALEYYNQALPLMRELKYRTGEASTLNNIGLVYSRMGERRKALEYLEPALQLWRAVQDRQNEGVTLDSLSAIYSFLGEKQKALASYQEALALARATGNRGGEATTLHNLGNFYNSISDMPKSLEYYEQSLAISRALGDRRREALTLTSIGVVYNDFGDLQKALEYYNQSLPLRRAVSDKRGEGVTLHNLGTLYLDVGKYPLALDHFNQALTIARTLGDRRGEAATLGRLAVVYDEMGEKQKALEHHQRALELNRAMTYPQGEAVTLNNIGFLYNSLGEREKALDYYTQALPIVRAIGNRNEEGSILSNIGKIHYALGDKQKAREFFTQSLALHQTVRNRNGEAIALHNLASLHNSLGARQEAITYYNQALALHQATGNRRQEAYTLHNLGGVYDNLGDKEKAIEYLNKSLAINQAIGDKEGEATTRFGLAQAERGRGNLKEAQTQVTAALALAETLRTSVASQELRASYLATVQGYYGLNIDLLMQMHKQEPSKGYNALALATSERARARSLLETLSEIRADIRSGVDTARLERERSLQQQLNAREQARMQLLARQHTPEQVALADKELRDLATQYQELQTQIKTSNPRYAALTQPQPLTLADIQQQVLDADTLLLQYALGEERSYLWAVSREAIASYELPKRAEVEAAARDYYAATIAFNQPSRMTNANTGHPTSVSPNTTAAGTKLSQMLLAPVTAQLGSKRLLIVADGALQYVPFAALPDPVVGGQLPVAGKKETANRQPITDDRQPLILNHELISLPSTSSFAVLRRELNGRKPAAKALALFADPVFAADDARLQRAQNAAKPEAQGTNEARDIDQPLTRALRETGLADASLRIPRLPGTRREAAAITSLLPEAQRKQALDFDASRATAISEELSQYRILHFATHGLLNSQHPELSGIVLSLVDAQGKPQDGFLRMHEIYNLKLPAELVVLSACQTGLGKEIKGEGLVGLTRGFMYAGAARVLASLWKVDDRATAELMKQFYQGMVKDGLRPAAALRAAQVQMWKQQRWQEPYYWAAFVLQGEWK